MSDFQTVSLSIANAVASVTLNRPDSLNAFNKTLRAELADVLQQVADDKNVRAVILTGTGRAFSAGADLKAGLPKQGQTVEQQLQDEYRPSLELINSMDKPVIAALNGAVAGIALGYMLACDLAIMADSAYLLSPFTTISLVGDGGVNWHLTRRLGYKKAFEYSIEGKKIDAQLALSAGLVNKVVPAEQLGVRAQKWAEKIVQRAPLSIAATKKAMRFGMQNSWESGFDLEARLQLALVGSDDNVEGVAAFLEKREAKFTGK